MDSEGSQLPDEPRIASVARVESNCSQLATRNATRRAVKETRAIAEDHIDAEDRIDAGGSQDSGWLPPKPMLRGWLHAFAAAGAVVVTVALAGRTRDDLPRLISMLVLGLSMIQQYAASALYHVGSWRGRQRTILRAVDHGSIFVLIAGTFTPFCVNVLSGWLRVAMLGLIWAMALAGVSMAAFALGFPRWARTMPYLGMGWAALVPLPEVIHLLPLEAVALMVLGGVLYTLGTVVYWLRRPNPLPRYFGFHEVFHLFTIAANAAFVATVWIWVVPFPRV